jgi:hypothetical protein
LGIFLGNFVTEFFNKDEFDAGRAVNNAKDLADHLLPKSLCLMAFSVIEGCQFRSAFFLEHAPPCL